LGLKVDGVNSELVSISSSLNGKTLLYRRQFWIDVSSNLITATSFRSFRLWERGWFWSHGW